ncbi:ABC transporter permease [Peribacillus frigoritolerans]|uniref:ABC transporter permease n=1 Tax=Peribacillus frigoritolerans TaxID=450367 RepID=UPI001F4F2127|nr:ABC transporter permease [Peribacillus frigoritolerans]MCK2017664.1 ABC transporter permease [Peribacillus frigoritolerans]WHY16044.1 ABC transporter permease [Peribacillus frigoritolerans]
MNKFWIVLSHTYLSKLKTKSFIISTIIMMALILVLSNLSNLIDKFDSDEQEKVAVIDQTEGGLFDSYKNAVAGVNDDLSIISVQDEKEAEEMVSAEEIVGYLLIQKDKTLGFKGTYKANQISDSAVSNDLLLALTQLKGQITAKELNLTEQQIAQLNTPPAFDTIALQKNAKTEEDLNQARGLVYVLLFVIYFGVLMYATMIAMEVATEKTSRVMEILISSVPPVTQMFAKIMGVALLSLTQMILFFGVGYFSIKQNLTGMDEGFFSFFGFGSTDISTIIYAIIFALLGYFLYATLAACLGSVVSKIEDVQQMISPMTMLVVIAFMIAMFGLGNPSASYITITSFIPFFTPMIMFLRVGMLEVPFWEIAISIGVLILTIVLLGIIGAKIYRGGVLMYGSSKSLKSIKNALQLSKKN